MKSSLRLFCHDPRVRTVAVVIAASGVAAVGAWNLARHGAPTPIAAPQAAANVPTASPTTLAPAVVEATLPTPEAAHKILDRIAAIDSAVPGNSVQKKEGEIARLTAVVKAQPDDAKTWTLLGNALTQKGPLIAAPDAIDAAEQCFARSLSLAPRNADALVGMAQTANTRHQFVESVAWAKKALAVTPRLDAAYGLIGDDAVSFGDYATAALAYQKMMDIRPSVDSYRRAAHFLYLKGDRRKALWLTQKAGKMAPPNSDDSAGCDSQVAEMYLDEGATLPAQQIVERDLKVHPDNDDLLVAMGRIQQAEGNPHGAIDAYQKAAALAPSPTTLIALGDLYDATGDKPKAEALYGQVEGAYDRQGADGSKDELDLARFLANHDRQMPRALTIAVAHTDAQSPADADTVAWVFYKSGKMTDAKTMINRALSLGEPDATLLYHAGMIYAKLGDRFPAQEYLNRSLSLDPHFSLRDTPVAVAELHDLGSRARPIAIASPQTPGAPVLR